MGNVFTLRNLGVAARVAAQQASQSRTLGAVLKAGRASVAHIGHVLHQLWLEVTGFVFLSIGAIGALAFVREYAKYRAGNAGAGRVVLAVCFTLMFAWFGVSSFWRVRKTRK